MVVSWCQLSLGHYKLHFCFWSWIFPRTMRAGATTASQPPIQVNERWSFVVKMLIKMSAHALCKLLRMLKIWKLPEACGRGTRNRSTTWSGLIYLARFCRYLCTFKGYTCSTTITHVRDSKFNSLVMEIITPQTYKYTDIIYTSVMKIF